MMMFTRNMIMMLMCLCMGQVWAADASLIQNGDFSNLNDAGAPANWRIPKNQDQIEVIAGDLAKYPKVLKVTLGPAQKGQGQVLQRFAIQPNHIYRLDGAMKSSGKGIGFFQLKLFKNKKELSRHPTAKSTTEWKEFSKEFYVGDADMAEVLLRYFLYPNSEGKTVEFANVSFTDLGEKVFVPPAIESCEVVTTFASAGLTLTLKGDPSKEITAEVRYREKNAEEWVRGQSLVFVPSTSEFRGSLLDLKSATDYVAEVYIADPQFEAGKAQKKEVLTFRTWTDDVPVARTVQLPAGVSTEALLISDQGSADGWVRYVGAPEGTILETGKSEKQAVRFENAAYVLFENVTVRGGREQGIVVTKSNHIRIRHCDIAHWGDPGTRSATRLPKGGLYVDENGKRINWQAGVMIAPGASQVVVENCFIHAANGTANSWQYGHPLGPQGVIMNNSEGNHVIRYNDIVGSEGHWWNDGIESMWNNREKGGPYRDTDIYGNLIAFSNDDGTELDGGQYNVRYFNNWVQWAYCGISCAPNLHGPSYVYRNVFVLGEERNRVNFGFKMGGSKFKNQGTSILFHNTIMSSNAGLSTGHFGKGASPIISRNNAMYSEVSYLKGGPTKAYNLDYDMLPAESVVPGPQGNYENAVWSKPEFMDAASGDYRLVANTAGVDQGVVLPGVNDGFLGDAPDIGAYEQGKDFYPIPQRPDGLMFIPAFLGFESGSADPSSREVRLTAPTKLGAGWKIIDQPAWLKITPSSGATSNKHQVLTVEVTNPPADLGLHRGSFTVKSSGGFYRTVPVQVVVRPANPVHLVLEAEDAEVMGRYQKFEDETAGGGAYMMIPFDVKAPIRFNKPEASDSELTFTFEVPEDGFYFITANIMIPGPDGIQKDSMYAAMNDAPLTRWNLSQAGRAAWNLQNLQGGAGTDGMAFELKAGKNTLHVRPREVGNQLDYLIISNER
ncbi:right-handed parallel beta-helix repeat-containing protein [Kiritimatiellota bacterium B12222]|nr:right-handed parallel beta-helix repeat-containing protein [Kiritimatiellota bacterium B12222]